MAAFDQVRAWPCASAVVGVTADASFASAGEIALRQPWASVTKMVTAYGLLRLVEVGDVELDDAAGPPGSTVRHLLAHASGLNLEGSATIARPGTRRIYSNGGYEILGGLIAERTGRSVGDYLAHAVFEPLQMSASALVGSPASGVVGSLADLLLFAHELLSPTLVAPETLTEASTVAFPGLDGVLPGFGRHNPNDWGLGFEIRDGKAPHWTGSTNSPDTFGHFGQTGSFLWVDPQARLACAALTSTRFGPWAASAWPAFSDAVRAEFSPRGL